MVEIEKNIRSIGNFGAESHFSTKTGERKPVKIQRRCGIYDPVPIAKLYRVANGRKGHPDLLFESQSEQG